MKRIMIITLILFSFSACDVLDVQPQNAILASDAFKNKAGIEKGILGAYSSFQNLSYYGRTYTIFSDLSADNLENPIDGTSTDYRQADNNNILPENGAVDGIWVSCYESINAANNVIAKVPSMTDMTSEEKNTALGELYFIRALNHFNLLNYFGAIPIKTTPTVGTTGLDVPRDAISDVYQQIIVDLSFAEANLPKSAALKTRASSYAATALLARVFLYSGAYAQAKAKATEVINSDAYDLINYADVFTDGSAESIFEIDFTDLNRNRIAEYNFPKSLNGRREVAPTQNLLDAYEVGDDRYPATIAFAGGLAYSIKYDDLAVGADNVIVIRFADMYLIRAEAEAKLSGNINTIKSDIDEIRSRASLSGTTANTHSDLLKVIEKERRIEFAFEGHRWFDLVRTGRAVEVLPNVNSVNQTLYPIPLEEIQTNKNPGMQQNNGY